MAIAVGSFNPWGVSELLFGHVFSYNLIFEIDIISNIQDTKTSMLSDMFVTISRTYDIQSVSKLFSFQDLIVNAKIYSVFQYVYIIPCGFV